MSVRLMTAVFDHHMPDLCVEKDGVRKTIKASTVKLVLLALADCANDSGKGAYPSIGTLAKKTAIRSRTTLVDCLDALQEAGYISYAGRSEYNTANYSLHMGALIVPASGLSQMEESPASVHAKVQPVEKKSPASGLKPSVNPSVNPSVKDSDTPSDFWEKELSPTQELTRVPFGEEFEEPKRQSAKQRRAERDAILDHPAIQAYRRQARLNVDFTWREAVANGVGTKPDDVTRWEAHIRDWIGAGWKKTNVKGMLESFQNGGIQQKNKREDAKARYEGRMQRLVNGN